MEVKSGLFEILPKIKARPGLYIGRPSLSDLFMFLVGYKTARRELGIELTEDEIRFYQNFHAFVEEKYHLHTANTWAKIILLYCSDEKQGFERFFELLAEFEQLQTKKVQNPMDETKKSSPIEPAVANLKDVILNEGVISPLTQKIQKS